MASITIPTPITSTCTTICTYIQNSNTDGVQTLLGDTNFTCSEHCLKYKGVPVFTNGYYTSETSYLFYAVKDGHGVSSASSSVMTYFGDGGDALYFYLFDTFIVITCDYTIDIVDSSNRNICIIDKTNAEVFDGFSHYGRNNMYGLIGIMFNYLESETPVFDRYYPTDAGVSSLVSRNTTLREESTTECSYVYLLGYSGKQASRVAMFTKFPRGSSNNVLHVDNKYFYILPMDETLATLVRYDYDGSAKYTETQEMYCTLGIDVTSEVS